MPRVHYVKAARKDNRAVKKGEPYYWWKFRYGGKRVSATRPRPSQLTQSKWSAVLSAQEEIEDSVDVESLESAIQIAIDTLSEVADEYRDAAESFGGEGPNAERAEHAESLQSELEDYHCRCEDDVDCPDCASDGTHDCETCEASGQVDCPGCGGDAEDCELCEGLGQIDCDDCDGVGNTECSTCDGAGCVSLCEAPSDVQEEHYEQIQQDVLALDWECPV